MQKSRMLLRQRESSCLLFPLIALNRFRPRGWCLITQLFRRSKSKKQFAFWQTFCGLADPLRAAQILSMHQKLAKPLHVCACDFEALLRECGPSLAFWRAAEVAVFREQRYERPVVDIGCGDGLVTSLIMKRAEIGIEPHPDFVINE